MITCNQVYNPNSKSLYLEIEYFVPNSPNHVGFLIVEYDKGEWAGISHLKVNGNHLRKGIASKMLEVAIEYAKQLNCRGIYLTVFMSNKKAIALYEKFGFEEHNEDWFNKTYEMVLELA